jgi:glycosyltransferase involved in cell wall biosynthesis
MRIAVVCTDLGVRVPGTKGASLHLTSISRAFQDVGNEVLLVGVRGHGSPPSGLATVLLDHPGRTVGLRRELRKIRFTAGLVPRVLPSVAAFAPDVVYERLALFGIAGRQLAGNCRARHVVEVNALLAQEEAQWRGLRLAALARRRERRVLDEADLRLPVSREVAAQVARISPNGLTEVVPNGLDDALFGSRPARGPSRELFGLPVDGPVLAFVGALRPWHGVDVAVRALPALPEAVLCIAGDGPVRDHLQRLAAELGVARRVRWLGQLPHGDVPWLLAAADIALAPYPELPGFGFSPLKLYEYLGAGVPVVASDVGQIRTVLDSGRWGSLVAPGDPAALAAGVRAVLADAPTARARADAARAMALREHSWRARATRITNILCDLGARHALAG